MVSEDKKNKKTSSGDSGSASEGKTEFLDQFMVQYSMGMSSLNPSENKEKNTEKQPDEKIKTTRSTDPSSVATKEVEEQSPLQETPSILDKVESAIESVMHTELEEEEPGLVSDIDEPGQEVQANKRVDPFATEDKGEGLGELSLSDFPDMLDNTEPSNVSDESKEDIVDELPSEPVQESLETTEEFPELPDSFAIESIPKPEPDRVQEDDSIVEEIESDNLSNDQVEEHSSTGEDDTGIWAFAEDTQEQSEEDELITEEEELLALDKEDEFGDFPDAFEDVPDESDTASSFENVEEESEPKPEPEPESVPVEPSANEDVSMLVEEGIEDDMSALPEAEQSFEGLDSLAEMSKQKPDNTEGNTADEETLTLSIDIPIQPLPGILEEAEELSEHAEQILATPSEEKEEVQQDTSELSLALQEPASEEHPKEDADTTEVTIENTENASEPIETDSQETPVPQEPHLLDDEELFEGEEVASIHGLNKDEIAALLGSDHIDDKALVATDNENSEELEDAPVTSTMRLGEKLVSKGLISSDQLEIALHVQRDSEGEKKMLGSILVEMGFITESALGEVLTESSGLKTFDLGSVVLDPKLICQVPKDVAIRCKAIPVSLEDNHVTIAISDVYNIIALDQLRRHFPKEYHLEPVFGSEQNILEIIDQYYDYEMSVDGILKEIETGKVESEELSGEVQGYINPTVRLVDALLIDAIKSGASDIHFEPEGAFLRLRYRIDGKLHQIRSFHKDYWAAIAVRIKIMSGMNIAETRNPQDGRISYNVLGREIDFRVATHPTEHGENIVMRILDKKKSLLPLEALGFSEHNINMLKKLLKRPEGIIIVTGPTGSGKTTTLYSVLNYINSIDVNIMTLEDPVEYQLTMIRQSGIREGAGMDFASGMKSLMRQDPDIIFLGEIRDQETATMAIRAAMTGHQVFSTLHTNDAMGAVSRLADIGIQPHLLSGSLVCVIAQRLARKLCNECKKPRQANEEECRIMGVDLETPPTVFEPIGCEHCLHSGYKGRIALTEILPVDRGLDELIATQATRKVMYDYALEHDLIPMALDAIDKVLQGVTDLDEIIRNINMVDRL